MGASTAQTLPPQGVDLAALGVAQRLVAALLVYLEVPTVLTMNFPIFETAVNAGA